MTEKYREKRRRSVKAARTSGNAVPLVRFSFFGSVAVGALRRFDVGAHPWESFSHWILKLLVVRYLLEAGLRPEAITLERQLGKFRADVFAQTERGGLWFECGRFTWDRLPGIRRRYAGRVIHVVHRAWFDRQVELLVPRARRPSGRTDWRKVHGGLLPFPGTALWAMEIVWTAPRLLYGVERVDDRFVFLHGWSVAGRLHPRRGDRVLRIGGPEFNSWVVRGV
ncbi:MAG: hypothetical protein QN155_11570 [Armatimonadota bacterium]|nr:hypothetical protein [Armatimonadota bacterium]MDR7404970.1 hypothetical protein [Armatimonadota bacterium]